MLGWRRQSTKFALAAAFALSVADVCAQAWLPPGGTTTIDYSYQSIFIQQHFLGHGETRDRGHIRAHVFMAQVLYSLSDRFAVSAAVPYVTSKYHGPAPHQLPIDDGTYHGTWQDYHFEARYQLSRGGLAVTPFAAAILPSHNYTYFAHSAVGRDLRETTIGSYFGTTNLFTHFRSCGCPTGTYLQSRIAYSFVERTLGYRPNHANADLDFGYFATEKFGVRGLASYGRTSGGVNWDYSWPQFTSVIFRNHDKLLNEHHFNVGAGASYAVSDHLDLFTSLMHTLQGRNGHKIALATNFGVAWSFGPKS